MRHTEPTAEVDARFSSEDARPERWRRARPIVKHAEIFWLSTVRPDGRPHVTPLIAVWLADTLYFCTGPNERKALNLARNPQCILTTGCNALNTGLDLVLEGDAVPVSDDAKLRRIARAYVAKYGRDWRFRVRNGCFVHDGARKGQVARVYEMAPRKALGFRRGAVYSQTRWRFRPE